MPAIASPARKTSAFGIYPTREMAENAVDRLLEAGFSNEDISVLLQANPCQPEPTTETHTKAPDGTTTGVAAGPIIAALSGIGSGGRLGGVIGALVGFGIPEYEAKRYEGRIKSGGILVSVACDTAESVQKAKQLLKDSGAEDIASVPQTRAAASA